MAEDDRREDGARNRVADENATSGRERRSTSRPSVRNSGARTTSRSGESRPTRTRSTRSTRAEDEGVETRTARSRATREDDRVSTRRATREDGQAQRPARRSASADGVRSNEGEARHHLLTNTTYSGARRRQASDREEGAYEERRSSSSRRGGSDEYDERPRPRTRARSSRDEEPQSGVGAVVGSVFGTVNAALDKLPFPKSYLLIVLAAIIVAIIIGAGVSTCSKPTENEQQAAEEAAQQEQQENDVNADIDESLRWRDTEFSVDTPHAKWNFNDNGRKVVYLTIDDGPSELTEQYLDLFDKYNVKATFFVTGHDPNYYHLIHEEYKRGHTVGLHSMTHDYAQMYSSEDAFYADLDQVAQVVKDQIGYVPCFIRFPGGSSNTQADNYSPGLMTKLVDGVQAKGYQYYDWNITSGDGDDISADGIISTIEGSELDTNLIVLCHDSATKQSTLEALPKVIEYYQNLGYTFEAIDCNTWVCHQIFSTNDMTQRQSAANSTATTSSTTTDGTTTDGTTTDGTTTDGTTTADGATTTDGAAEGTGDTAESDTSGEAQTDADGDFV